VFLAITAVAVHRLLFDNRPTTWMTALCGLFAIFSLTATLAAFRGDRRPPPGADAADEGVAGLREGSGLTSLVESQVPYGRMGGSTVLASRTRRFAA